MSTLTVHYREILIKEINTLPEDTLPKVISFIQLFKDIFIFQQSRQGWEQFFRQMHENGDDKLLISDKIDMGDWEWN